MKVKTADLIGPALDWAVAKIDQPQWSDYDCELWVQDDEYQYSPSTIWSQGGPIIEREGLSIRQVDDGTWRSDFSRAVLKADGSAYAFLQKAGPTPLIAAMRCFVASRLGDEVDIPEELLK